MRFIWMPIGVVTLFVLLSSSASADWLDEIGWRSLLLQEGGVLEDGSDIDVSQVEVPISGAYMPNTGIGQFTGKTFIDASGYNVGSSGHATNVGRVFYGNTFGMGGGITTISNYDVNDWANNVLGFASGGDPLPQPFQVQNHSWIGNGNGAAISTDVLQRVDFITNQDNITFTVGTTNNDSAVPELLLHGYNLISVGKSVGGHGHGATRFYGAGRTKPEIVVPQTTLPNATSWGTPVVGSAAALLREAGGGANGNQTNATQNEQIKAFLLAGATKEEFASWDRTTTRPLDDVRGAGELNIHHSYNMLQGGEFDGTSALPGVAANLMGWDYSDSITTEKFYSFNVSNGATDVSIILTWNIDVVDLDPAPNVFDAQTTLADMNLELFDANDVLIDSSFSPVDNIEHIYLTSLPAGQYTLRVESDMDYDYGLAWRFTANPAPDSFLVTIGTNVSGGISELNSSDDQYLVMNPRFLASRYQNEFTVNATAPTETPSFMEFSLEANVRNFVGTVDQKIELFNYDTGSYETVDNRFATATDSVVVVTPGGDPSQFVEPGTRAMQARISYQNSLPYWVTRIANLYLPFRTNVDHVFWSVF